MSRAKRIVRFTFWTNNVCFLLILGTFLYLIANVSSLIWILSTFLLLVVTIFNYWYLRRHLGVKSVRNTFYFTDDERDRQIAMKVHTSVMTLLLYGLMMELPIFFSLWEFDISRSVLVMGLFIYAILVMFSSNVQYYYLWCKYDRN